MRSGWSFRSFAGRRRRAWGCDGVGALTRRNVQVWPLTAIHHTAFYELFNLQSRSTLDCDIARSKARIALQSPPIWIEKDRRLESTASSSEPFRSLNSINLVAKERGSLVVARRVSLRPSQKKNHLSTPIILMRYCSNAPVQCDESVQVVRCFRCVLPQLFAAANQCACNQSVERATSTARVDACLRGQASQNPA
jgi:hypothetical protein